MPSHRSRSDSAVQSLLAVVALVALAGCSPTAEDEANMVEMVKLEDQQAEVVEKNPTDCKKLQADLSAVTKSNRAKADELGAWWDGLSSGKREKLNEKHKRYRLPMAMMKANSCRDAVTAGLAAK